MPRRAALLAILAIGFSKIPPAGAVSPAKESLPELNQKVVSFARAQLGRRVGDGDCLTLAIAALNEAGATDYSLADPKGNYVWGKPVSPPKDALPGDILQFRDAVFDGKKYVTKRRWISWHQEYPHHTAVVSGVQDGGKTLLILHQNVGGDGVDEPRKRTVQEGTIRLDSLRPGGWVRVYRPSRREVPSESEARHPEEGTPESPPPDVPSRPAQPSSGS